VLIILLFSFAETLSFANEWKAGVASSLITPDKPMWTAGYGGRTEPAVDKISNLYVKALALNDPFGNSMVILTSDLIGINFDTCVNVASKVAEKYNIPRHSILFSASHTHGGPELRPYGQDQPPGYHSMVIDKNIVPEEYGARIAVYVKWLEEKMVETIGRAIDDMKPSRLNFTTGQPTPFAVSRRFPGPDGILYRSTPSSYYTGGPRDDTVPVLKVEGIDGKVRAILFGYACHPITLDANEFNADYPGYAQEYIEKDFPGAIAMFMQGCSGQLVPNSRFQIEYAQGHGKALAQAVRNAIKDGRQTTVTGPLRSAYNEVKLEFIPIPPKNIIAAEKNSSNTAVKSKAEFLFGKLEKGETIDLGINCPIQAISFGKELLLIGISGDVVVDYAVKVKTIFADKASFVWASGYCNGYIWGYLPTYTILKEGGYESSERFPLGPFTDDVEDRVMNGIRGLVGIVTR
jgi:hypothetical protein